MLFLLFFLDCWPDRAAFSFQLSEIRHPNGLVLAYSWLCMKFHTYKEVRLENYRQLPGIMMSPDRHSLWASRIRISIHIYQWTFTMTQSRYHISHIVAVIQLRPVQKHGFIPTLEANALMIATQ